MNEISERLSDLLRFLAPLALEALAQETGELADLTRSLIKTRVSGPQQRWDTLSAIADRIEDRANQSPFALPVARALEETGNIYADSQVLQQLLQVQQQILTNTQALLDQGQRKYSPPSRISKEEKDRQTLKLIRALQSVLHLLPEALKIDAKSYKSGEPFPVIIRQLILAIGNQYLHPGENVYQSLLRRAQTTGGPTFTVANWYNLAGGRNKTRHDGMLPWLHDELDNLKKIWTEEGKL
jgi:hypothetical protein